MDPSSNLAARISPELLDLIFEFAVEAERIEPSIWGQPRWEIRNARDFALVCRSWRVPAHRVLFRTSLARDDGLWESNADEVNSNVEILRPFIRSMKVRVRERRRSVQELSNYLQLFPSLANLDLLLTDRNGIGYQDDYSALATLPNLRHLRLASDKFDVELSSYRQILQSTPNITSLFLHNSRASGEVAVVDPGFTPQPSTITPVHLPCLTKLSLNGNQYILFFNKLNLLSDETLENVVELHLERGFRDYNHQHYRRYTATPFLLKLGKQLTTFGLSHRRLGGPTLAEILELCPNITVLEGAVHEDLAALTPSIRTVDLTTFQITATTLLGEYFKKNIPYLKNVEVLKMFSGHGDHERLVALAKPFCAQVKGLSLVVDGLLVDMSDVVVEAEHGEEGST